MELVYLWVEDYKNIHHQGFNFSPRFNCHYNEDKDELTIAENNDYIENFFGDNINVTAIVGKNGSGKSSVLNAIVNCIEENLTEENQYILVFREENTNYYLSTKKISTTLKKSNDTHKHKTIVYLDRLDNDDIPINASATRLSSYKHHKHAFINYREIDISKEMIVRLIVLEIGKVNDSFHLSTFMYLPNKITIKLKAKEYLIGEHINFIFEDKQTVENYFIALSDIEHQLLIIKYLRKYRISFDIKIMKNKQSIQEKLGKNISKEISKIFELSYNPKEDISISSLIEEDKDLYIRKGGYSYLLDFDLIDSKGRRYNHLSHGEKNIFGQLLNIFFSAQEKSLMFLFDEPEIALHPDWQRKYMSEVITLFKNMESESHFIFSSHSPFLLSDLPKQNIIFLDTYKKHDEEVTNGNQEIGNCKVVDGLNEKKQTFGANIHTLLSDSFFMENGLMGEFAKGKINEIKTFYEKVIEEKKTQVNEEFYKTNQKKFWQIQKIIGEPFLQKIVQNQLEEIELILLGQNEAIDKEIERLQALKKSANA